MDKPGPPRIVSARKGAGGPVLLSARRQSMGWPALIFSIGLHGAVMAAAMWFVAGSQGSDGDAGDQLVDEDSASVPVPVFRPQPKPEVRPAVVPRPVTTFRPANLPRLLAKTNQAELVMPKWEMAPMKPIEAPPPAPKAEAKPQPQAVASALPSKGKAAQTKRKAVGKGSSTGAGDSVIAAETPKLISSYPPPYPAQARRDHAEGTAMVKVMVGSNGRVIDCSIWTSTGNESLDAAALRAVKGWRFTPAQSASASVLVRVSFRLS